MFTSTLTRRQTLKLAGVAALGAAGVLRHTPASASTAGRYELIDIAQTDPDAMNPAWVGCNAMNRDGVVAGNMWVSAEKRSPWVYADGRLRRIKTGEFGGLVAAINDQGVLAGRDLLGWHDAMTPWGQPVLWVEGEKQVLPYPDTLPAKATEGRVNAINNDGVAVGAVQVEGGAPYPVVWRDGTATVLPSLFERGAGTANSINDAGVIVGTVTDDRGNTLGGMWRNDEVAPLWSIPGAEDQIRVNAIDTGGIIAGAGWSGGRWDAMVWREGSSQLPDVLPDVLETQAEAVALASNGEGLFGGSAMDALRDQTAVIWRDGTGLDLNTLVENLGEVRLLVVRAIAADGRIAASARYPDGTIHAVLLQPLP